MKNRVAKKIIDILIQNEGRDVKIVFLPYKVEMWDSFKSVYREAAKEKLNLAIFPLHYHTLRYGNSVGDMKYDDWSDFKRSHRLLHTYDEFEKFNPDIVVIHYPFDYRNSVTIIPEDFQSLSLRMDDRTIVYIPYHGSCTTADESKLPGILNSDYIFAVRESDLQFYPKNRKVFVVGSTKLDLVQYKGYSNEILIINSLAPFISDKDRLEKYLQIIAENKGKTIRFRPHPLMLSTIESLQPERLLRYKRFIDDIQKQGVIVDTTKNVYTVINRAAKIYSDPSSIATVCRLAHVEVNII